MSRFEARLSFFELLPSLKGKYLLNRSVSSVSFTKKNEDSFYKTEKLSLNSSLKYEGKIFDLYFVANHS